MLKKATFYIVICFLFTGEGTHRQNRTIHKYIYPESYRDHVYYNLSENGRDMFFAVNIHPRCVEKKGQCIPRAKCVGKKMLYFSRVCYKRDLVCCYDDTIRFPIVVESVTLSTPSASSTPRILSTPRITATTNKQNTPEAK